ncbi:unknown [Acidaminococcus sp. CAG:542]|nr:unknown [Acidaminococcus sp. CAG:542]
MPAKKIPSVRAIRFPRGWESPLPPESMKHRTPAMITATGRKARRLKYRVWNQYSRNSQMVAVYCMPMAMAAEVRDRETITLRHRAQ